MPRFDLTNYVPVQERIVQFWNDHPEGRILTALASDPGDFTTCRYRAEVYRDAGDDRPAATGYAVEKAGGGGANQTSHEENGETSAIGRALANLGYATSQQDRPSREEMSKVNRDEPQLTPHPQSRQAQPQGRYVGTPAPDARPHEPAIPASADQPATAAQLKAIFGIGRSLGMSPDDVKAFVAEQFKVDSIDNLPKRQASILIDQWQADAAGVPA